MDVPAGPGGRAGEPEAVPRGEAGREERTVLDSPRRAAGAQGPVPWRYVFRGSPVAASLATAFGVGLLPGPAGTWGSLATVIAAELLFSARGTGPVLLLAAAATLAGPWAAGRTAGARGERDPNEVVIDEVAGQSIALCGLHLAFPALGAGGLDVPYAAALLVAFGLFRLLDIFKPGPVGALERLPGGVGIMADDLLAGLLAGVVFPLAALAGIGRLLP